MLVEEKFVQFTQFIQFVQCFQYIHSANSSNSPEWLTPKSDSREWHQRVIPESDTREWHQQITPEIDTRGWHQRVAPESDTTKKEKNTREHTTLESILETRALRQHSEITQRTCWRSPTSLGSAKGYYIDDVLSAKQKVTIKLLENVFVPVMV